MISPTPQEFERHRLSKRENEILGYAIEGMTDIQIAQKLDISQSTVNSYWVRIRGKLGQLSRTELVALALKQKHRDEMESLLAQSQEFERQADERERDNELVEQAELYQAILRAMPEAMLVCDEAGSIVFTNARLDAMFGYAVGTLVGQHVTVLIPERMRRADCRSISDYLADPRPLCVGSEEAVYGRRQNRTEFRVMVLMDAAMTSNGPVTTCIVRDFMHEVSTRRRFAAAGNDLAHLG